MFVSTMALHVCAGPTAVRIHQSDDHPVIATGEIFCLNVPGPADMGYSRLKVFPPE